MPGQARNGLKNMNENIQGKPQYQTQTPWHFPASTASLPGTSRIHTLPHWGKETPPPCLLIRSCTMPKNQHCPVRATGESRAHRRERGDPPALSPWESHTGARAPRLPKPQHGLKDGRVPTLCWAVVEKPSRDPIHQGRPLWPYKKR